MPNKDDVSQSPDSVDASSKKKGPSLKKRLSKIKPTKRNIDRSEKKVLRHADKFIISRWNNLRLVRREIAGWLVLVAFLIMSAFVQIAIYSQNNSLLKPANGGTYAEGIIGKIDTFSPLYAATDRERAVSKLVYSGLLEYDETGNLRPELAKTYSISDDGKTYTVKLRSGIRWSDGEPFNVDDVVMTVNLMKNTLVDSVLANSWKSIEVKKIDNQTLTFTLKSPLASFPFALTFGVLPHHIMKDVTPSTVRGFSVESVDRIVGTGPFIYSSSEMLSGGHNLLHFVANGKYFRGKPRLAAFNVQTYETLDDLLSGFKNKEVNAASGLNVAKAKDSLSMDTSSLVQTPLADGVFTLFNNTNPITGSQEVRKALRLATDRTMLRSMAVLRDNAQDTQLAPPTALETPMLASSTSGISDIKQPEYDNKAAAEMLDAVGWKLNADHKREKDGTVMALDMVTIKDTDYEQVAVALADSWRQLGIEVNLTIADPNSVQQNYFLTRNYDVLVYQIHLGTDPDVYAYWGSSQANVYGLNLANYKSTISDLALTNARTQTDETKRSARYADFVKRWIADAPAIALYQPNFYYLKSAESNSIDANFNMADSSARFSDVALWTIRVKQLRSTP